LIAEAAMPALTAIAKPRIVSFGLTWRESVIPTPTTGKDSPTNAATNIPASDSAIRSGGAMFMTVPTAPLKIVPPPAPITAPAAMNSARDGGRSQTARTVSPSPVTIAVMPASNSRVTGQAAVRICAATADAYTAPKTAPASARDG
jgi:hypothetical protein